MCGVCVCRGNVVCICVYGHVEEHRLCACYPIYATLYMLPCICYPVYATLYMLPCICYPVHATIYMLPYTCYHIHATLYMLPYTCYHIHATIYMLPYTCYPIHATLYMLPYTCHPVNCPTSFPMGIHLYIPSTYTQHIHTAQTPSKHPHTHTHPPPKTTTIHPGSASGTSARGSSVLLNPDSTSSSVVNVTSLLRSCPFQGIKEQLLVPRSNTHAAHAVDCTLHDDWHKYGEVMSGRVTAVTLLGTKRTPISTAPAMGNPHTLLLLRSKVPAESTLARLGPVQLAPAAEQLYRSMEHVLVRGV